jgi:hypothetical protein
MLAGGEGHGYFETVGRSPIRDRLAPLDRATVSARIQGINEIEFLCISDLSVRTSTTNLCDALESSKQPPGPEIGLQWRTTRSKDSQSCTCGFVSISHAPLDSLVRSLLTTDDLSERFRGLKTAPPSTFEWREKWHRFLRTIGLLSKRSLRGNPDTSFTKIIFKSPRNRSATRALNLCPLSNCRRT